MITGLGVLSPIGSGVPAFWQGLLAGQVGTGPIQAFDTSMFDSHIGKKVRAVDPVQAFRVLDPAVCGRTTRLAVAAAWQAANDTQVLQASYDRELYGNHDGQCLDLEREQYPQGPAWPPAASLVACPL